MTWLTKQALKLWCVSEISPVLCEAAFLEAKHCSQYGVVFCSLQWELPVVQKPQIVMLPWIFSCHRLAYFEAFITLLVHLSQSSFSSQRSILPIGEHPSEVQEQRSKSLPSATNPVQAQEPQLHLWSGLETWLEKRKKKKSLNHPKAVIMLGSDLTPQGIVKLKQLWFLLRGLI